MVRAPSASPPPPQPAAPADGGRTKLAAPLQLNGSFAELLASRKVASTDLTPVIGTKYEEGLKMRDLLALPDEERKRVFNDLALTISTRGVVFFKNQDVTPTEMHEFTELVSRAGGAPASSGFHIHPTTDEKYELGDEYQEISSRKLRKSGAWDTLRAKWTSSGWHSDITFEAVPSDYSMLRIHTLPESGGDTLWAFTPALYANFSPAYQTFLESLKATHDGNRFHGDAERLGQKIRDSIERGSPFNFGPDLKTLHPVVRSNPVTGWRSIFVNKAFTKKIDNLTPQESEQVLEYLFNHHVHNHACQIRYKWDKHDVALWDNRSTYHTATYDYQGARAGDRVCSLGEKPYLDPNSTVFGADL